MDTPPRLILHSEEDRPAYSEDGVDLTLIRWMLTFTPTERLNILQQSMISINRLKNAGIRAATHRKGFGI